MGSIPRWRTDPIPGTKPEFEHLEERPAALLLVPDDGLVAGMAHKRRPDGHGEE